MDKYELVRMYIEGALSIELDSDFGRAYQKSLRSLKDYMTQLDEREERISARTLKEIDEALTRNIG